MPAVTVQPASRLVPAGRAHHPPAPTPPCISRTNVQIKSNQSYVWSAAPMASPPNYAVSWGSVPVVAVVQAGAIDTVAVWAAVQSFYPFSPDLPAAELAVWARRVPGARLGTPPPGAPPPPRSGELVQCATARLPMPARGAQLGRRVRVDLAACSPAAALVFGLANRTAYFDSPNPWFESDQYFTLDDLEARAWSGGGRAG